MAEGFVSQHTAVYCDQIGHEAVGLCRDTGPRNGQPGHHTAQGRACDTATRSVTRPGARPRHDATTRVHARLAGTWACKLGKLRTWCT